VKFKLLCRTAERIIEKSELGLRNQWDTIKQICIYSMGVPMNNRQRAETIFEEMMAKSPKSDEKQ
jgi:hypothetical protein